MWGFLSAGHYSVQFTHHLLRHATKRPGKREMSVQKSEAERARAKAAPLARHYRAIGPAAIVAALICARKKPAKPAGPKAA